MRRVIFAVLFAAGLLLWRYSPAGLFLSAALLAAAVAAVIENLAENYKVEVRYDRKILQKNEAPLLFFGGKKRLKGQVVCENIVTGERTFTDVDIRKERTAALPAQKDCGGLFIRFMCFRRYDILGLTCRTVVCFSDEYVTVMPSPAEITEILDKTSGEAERDGAREYRPDEPSRHINFKLTHRFGKPYINTFAPENAGDIIIFADLGLGEDAAKAAEMICSLGDSLLAQGTPFDLVFPDGEEDVRTVERPDSETLYHEVLHFPLSGGEGYSLLGTMLKKADEDARIIAFTKNTKVQDDRLLFIL